MKDSWYSHLHWRWGSVVVAGRAEAGGGLVQLVSDIEGIAPSLQQIGIAT